MRTTLLGSGRQEINQQRHRQEAKDIPESFEGVVRFPVAVVHK